jgi:hypothetical protein
VRAAWLAGDSIAVSRPVTTVATFSTVTGSPSTAATDSSVPIQPPSSTSRRPARTESPLRYTAVRAPTATRTWDVLVSTSTSTVSLAGREVSRTSKCTLASLRYRGTSQFFTRPSTADWISSRPLQSSGRIVVSSAATWASAMLTRRRCATEVVRPSASRNRNLRTSTASPRSRRWVCSSTSTSSMRNHGPSSTRKVSGSQLGRLTMLSLSTVRPDISSVSRLKTPATYVPG